MQLSILNGCSGFFFVCLVLGKFNLGSCFVSLLILPPSQMDLQTRNRFIYQPLVFEKLIQIFLSLYPWVQRVKFVFCQNKHSATTNLYPKDSLSTHEYSRLLTLPDSSNTNPNAPRLDQSVTNSDSASSSLDHCSFSGEDAGLRSKANR